MERTNLHATALVLGWRGVLVCGPSGAGKSSLALHLLDFSSGRHGCDGFACLVADDRVWVRATAGRLVAEAPEAIAGLIEARGFGPARRAHETRAVIDLVVRLVDAAEAPRHRRDDAESILGVTLPRLDLAARDTGAAARAVAAWLANW